MTTKKHHRKLKRLAEEQGWEFIEQVKGSHPRLRSPEGKVVIFPGSPSGVRSSQNLLAELRRAGLKIPRGFNPL